MSDHGFEQQRSEGASAGRFAVWLTAIALGVCLFPAAVSGQGLPSADELEEEPEDEQVELDEASEESGDEGEANEGDDEASGDEGEEEASGDEGQEGADEEAEGDEQEGEDRAERSEEDGEGSEDEAKRRADGAAEASGHPWRQNLVEAGVNLEGARGFQHTTSAKVGEPNTYRIGFLGYFSAGSDFIRYQDYNEFVAGHLVVEASILEYLSVNVGMRATNNVNSFGSPQAMLSQGDSHLGVRGHYNPTPGFHIGGDVTTYVPTGFATSGLDFSASSVRPRLLLSAEFDELVPPIDDYAIPLDLHFNAGYRLDNSSELLFEGQAIDRVERFAHGISSYDAVEFGLGLEYGFPYVSPFVSWNLDVPVNPDEGTCSDPALECATDAGFLGFPNVLSVGARAEPVRNLGLTAGVDIGLTSEDVAGLPVTPPWQAMLGASWTVDPTPASVDASPDATGDDKETRAFVVGEITDAKSEDPIEGVMIRYVTPEGKTPQMSDKEGRYHSYRFERDQEAVVEFTHADYETLEETVELDEEGEHELDVALEPSLDLATVTGRVVGADGEPLADVSVSLEGPRDQKVTTDEEGRFKARVEAGNYLVTANDIDHMLGGREIELEADDEERFDIELAASPDERSVELGDDRLELDEAVSFAKDTTDFTDGSRQVLDQVAALLFEEPQIARMRIEAHVDDAGDEDSVELTEAQAEKVRDYLVDRGLDADRFETEGLGDQEPRFPNTSKRNRERNRRVEFHIIDRELDESERRAESDDSDESDESDESERRAESDDSDE